MNRAELGDGSTLFVFGSEREAQAAAQSAPSSAAPVHIQEAHAEASQEGVEAVDSSPEAAAEPATAEDGSLAEESPAEAHDEPAQQPAASHASGPLTEDELSEMKASNRVPAHTWTAQPVRQLQEGCHALPSNYTAHKLSLAGMDAGGGAEGTLPTEGGSGLQQPT